jgi:GNAT superfamily N-acetyltransferase
MQTHPKLTIRRTSWSNPVGRDLRAAQQSELDARYGHARHEAGEPPTAADMAVFLIAYERATGQPLGCGGLRWLDRTTAEVKRVYVLPYARGAGVASSILLALEAEAHQTGITRPARPSPTGRCSTRRPATGRCRTSARTRR